MSREIKFRVWDKVNNTMITYQTMCSCPDMTLNGVLMSHDKQSNVSYQYDLMQYTGLNDKDGVEIYGGDILSYLDFVGYFIVKWGHWGWRLEGTIPEEDRHMQQWPPITMPSGNFEDIKVIGNIHEKPELLEPQNDT